MKIKKTRKGPFDIILFGDVMLMTVFGLIMIFSASSPSAFARTGNSYFFVGKQLIWTVLGLVSLFVCASLDYKLYKKWAVPLLAVSFVLLLVVLVGGWESNGAKRWINFGFATVQPSEFTKIAIVIGLAAYFDSLKNTVQTFKNVYIPLALIVGLPCGLIIFQPHFSAIVIIGLTTLLMMIVFGIKFKFYVPAFLIGIPTAVGLVIAEPYRLQRITAFMNPFADIQGDGWQIVQSLYAIGSGGLFGFGLTRSRQKYMYIPEPQNDFIFSIICEELGIVGAIFVILLFAILLWRCVVIALNCKDSFGTMLAFGLGILTIVQVVLNIGVATSSIPPTGVPLPFFSAGGSSFVFQMISMGILLSISRNKE